MYMTEADDSPEVCLTVAVMKKPDNLCLDILLRESELLWEDVTHRGYRCLGGA